MRIAADAIPGSLIPMWFKPIKTGTYEVVCGQLCGLGHYGMKGSVVVDSPADYQAWLKERAEMNAQQQNAPPATQQPPGAPGAGPTPSTVPPPGAPKTENPAAKPEQKPAQPVPSPSGE
jgi:cytochrome c oxidase subunit 2